MPTVFYDTSLNSDPSWPISGGEWSFGQPAGGGGRLGFADPTSGRTGVNVYGVNLSGDYSTAVGGPYYLTAGPFDCSDYSDVTLSFARWLNTDYAPYVKTKIEDSSNGSDFDPVWEYSLGVEMVQNAWNTYEYD